MAIALVGSHMAGAPSPGNTATTTGFDSTGANLGIVLVTYYPGGTPPTISDSKGNSWSALTLRQSGGTLTNHRIYWSTLTSVGAGHTATANGSGSFPTLAFAAFSGALAVSPFDQQNGAGNVGLFDISTGSITPSEDNCLVVSGVSISGNDTFTVTGVTEVAEVGNDGNHQAGAWGYVIQATAAAVNPNWDWANEMAAATSVASFKAAGGPPAGATVQQFVNAAIVNRGLINSGRVN